MRYDFYKNKTARLKKIISASTYEMFFKWTWFKIFLAAQMIITDITSCDHRSTSLGRLSVSYGLGMVIGPVVGGFCVKNASEHAAAYVAAFGSLASVAVSFYCIPYKTKVLKVSILFKSKTI